ncbi:hypothetical protein T06_6985, partial [Trichinella sp. T6]
MVHAKFVCLSVYRCDDNCTLRLSDCSVQFLLQPFFYNRTCTGVQLHNDEACKTLCHTCIPLELTAISLYIVRNVCVWSSMS